MFIIEIYKMPKLLSKKKKNDSELCQIIATSITEIVRDSLNPTFRQTYFNTIQVTNSTDAQEFLENRLLNVLGVNKSFVSTYIQKKNNMNVRRTFVIEDYLAAKILCSSDTVNKYKYSEMISLIKHLMNKNSCKSK
ncbi:Uncharacterized protein FWK35_00027290 [Aphis craccivora]|uniref:Uncharacterized protein n=1 Tax=Aphis craccivora TaxID=307492 RepID=A0A6G0Y7D2_APHCR|nr:Uncharacterized protein FWK35_00027290 [Aphis craccivora]